MKRATRSAAILRVVRCLPIALLATVVLSLVGASTSALAIPVGHTYDRSFGEYGTAGGQFRVEYSGMGMDVDQSNGDIYIADTSNFRVQKFDEDGNFILTWGYGVKNGADEFQVCKAPETCQEGLFGNAPGQFQNPMSVAVDSSGGPNDGDVYVVDANSPCCAPGGGRQVILKFSEEGQYLSTITGEGSPSGHFYNLPWRRGVSVDNQGFVWVLDGIDFGVTPRVLKFSNQASNAYVGGSEWIPTISPRGNPETGFTWEFAVAPDGSHVYLMGMSEECEWVYRFVANGSASRRVLRIPACFGFSSDVAISPANEHVFFNRGNQIQEYIDNPLGPETVGPEFGPEQLNEVQGLVVNGDTGEVYAGDPSQAKVFVFHARRVPEVITGEATGVLHTMATINGHTAPDPVDGGPVNACHFEWGLTTTYEHVTECEQSPPFAGPTDVHLDLTGLQQEGVYHYRLVTANSIATEVGRDRTFTPHAVLDLSTDQASTLTSHSATLNGSLEPAGEAAEYLFEWGKQAVNLDHATPLETSGAGTGVTSVSTAIEGLEDYTEYHYRIRATNSFGTSYGDVEAFRTKPADVPTISNIDADQVTGDRAHLSAVVTPNWGETIYGFEYGETRSYGTQVLGGGILGADAQAHSVSVNVSGLEPGTTYHYRALATNFGGISYGPDQSFTTLDVPGVISETASGIASNGARLNALVSPSQSATTVHFEYGTSPAYGSTTPAVAIGSGGSPVNAAIDVSGLFSTTTYHFRAVATNEVGTEVGPDQSFTTTPPPPEAAPPAPTRCKRGFVRRRGKCVKKKHSSRHRHHRKATHHKRRDAR